MKLTRKEFVESPVLQRQYKEWLKHPFTEKVVEIIESERDALPIFPSPEHLTGMYAGVKLGNFAGIVWTLKRILSLDEKPVEIIMPESTYEPEPTPEHKARSTK